MDGEENTGAVEVPAPVGLKLKYKQVETRVRDLRPGDLVITDEGVIEIAAIAAARPVDNEGNQFFTFLVWNVYHCEWRIWDAWQFGDIADELTLALAG